MTGTHEVIYVAATVAQAYALKNLLADHGITAYVSNDTLNSVHFTGGDLFVRLGGGPGLHDTAPRVVVLQQDAPEARRIALEAESTLQQGLASPELTQLEDEFGPDAPWPCCPHCSRPRLTSCPVCETAGTHFPEAFMPDDAWHTDSDPAGGGPEPLLVLCPTCDEPFAPQFPARCEWCGHRFADGYEPPGSNLLVTSPFMAAEANLRVAAVVLGLAILAALVLGWFYFIANYSGG